MVETDSWGPDQFIYMKIILPKAVPKEERHEVRIGQLGGRATAAKMTSTEKVSRASTAGSATLKSYGVEYYANLAKIAAKARRDKCQTSS